jgi:hypothetical protein
MKVEAWQLARLMAQFLAPDGSKLMDLAADQRSPRGFALAAGVSMSINVQPSLEAVELPRTRGLIQ